MTTFTRTARPHYEPLAPTPADEVLHLMRGFVVAKSLYTATRLGIPDQLRSGPLPADEVARRTNTNPDAIFRLLRALASIGVFAETAPHTFGLGRLGPALCTDTPSSVRPWV